MISLLPHLAVLTAALCRHFAVYWPAPLFLVGVRGRSFIVCGILLRRELHAVSSSVNCQGDEVVITRLQAIHQSHCFTCASRNWIPAVQLSRATYTVPRELAVLQLDRDGEGCCQVFRLPGDRRGIWGAGQRSPCISARC